VERLGYGRKPWLSLDFSQNKQHQSSAGNTPPSQLEQPCCGSIDEIETSQMAAGMNTQAGPARPGARFARLC